MSSTTITETDSDVQATREEIMALLWMNKQEYDEFIFELACEWVSFRKLRVVKSQDKVFIFSKIFHKWFRHQLYLLDLQLLANRNTPNVKAGTSALSLAEYMHYVFHNLIFTPTVEVYNDILHEGADILKLKPELEEVEI